MPEFEELECIIAQTTETKAEAQDFTSATADADFLPEPETVGTREEGEKDPLSDIDPEEAADFIVEGLDSLSKWLLPLAFEKITFSKEEALIARVYKDYLRAKQNPTQIPGFTEEILDKITADADYTEAVPLEESEKQKLKKRFAAYLGTANIKMSPGWVLLGTLAITFAPKVAPLGIAYAAKNGKTD